MFGLTVGDPATAFNGTATNEEETNWNFTQISASDTTMWYRNVHGKNEDGIQGGKFVLLTPSCVHGLGQSSLHLFRHRGLGFALWHQALGGQWRCAKGWVRNGQVSSGLLNDDLGGHRAATKHLLVGFRREHSGQPLMNVSWVKYWLLKSPYPQITWNY